MAASARRRAVEAFVPEPAAWETKRADVALSRVSESGVFEGYASLFGVLDACGDIVAPSAFATTLRKRGAAGVKMLWQHLPDEPIGVWTEIVEDGRGLRVTGRLDLSVARAREALSLIRTGALDGLSIGFRTQRAASDRVSGARRLLEVDLWEISIVTFPALPQARIGAVKRAAPVPIVARRRGAPLAAIGATLARLRMQAAALRFETKLRRLSRALDRRYSPNQPRVPAGSPGGGQWTSGGGGSGAVSDVSPVQVALNTVANVVSDATATLLVGERDPGRYAVDLEAEEGYSHAIRDHVGKSDEELLNVLRKDYIKFGIRGIGVIDYHPAEGSFDSRESANDFVNRTLEANRDLVDLVASGKEKAYKLDRIFGHVTGKEAFRNRGDSEPYVRPTYAVRVVVHHDPNSERGYRLRTAFPFNPGRRR